MLFLSPGLATYFLFLTALLGLCMGSFFNCFAWRMAHGESILKGRSHCPACGHALGASDLVPVFSYVFLRGRCRYCGERISPRYPATELVSLLVFLSLVLRYDITLTTLRLLVLACLLFTVALVDLEVRRIPDGLLLAAVIWYLATLPLVAPKFLPALRQGLLGGLLVAGPLLLFVLLADRLLGRESMGGGDIKLFFVVGLYLGPALNLLNLILSCILGVIFGMIFRPRREDSSRAIPFGPAAAAGTWLTLLWGNAILHWYLGLFF